VYEAVNPNSVERREIPDVGGISGDRPEGGIDLPA
jgi:hypothetical protein